MRVAKRLGRRALSAYGGRLSRLIRLARRICFAGPIAIIVGCGSVTSTSMTGVAGAGGGGGVGGALTASGGMGGHLQGCQQGATCGGGDTCEGVCANGKQTYCTCVLPSGSSMQYACVRRVCGPDAGVDGGGQPPFCPADVKTGLVVCDPSAESVCETPCNNMLQTECVCSTRNGTSRWICATQDHSC